MSQSDPGDSFESEGVCQPGNENTGRWTSEEHRLFLQGLELHGKGWKQIATLIQTRTVVQIRTHAQKYFQKLSKAQASGTSHLDPATLMSTMDAGKPRPATVARNLRSSVIANSAAETEGRLRSLRKRHNRGRHSRTDEGHEDYSDDTSDDNKSTSSSSSSGGGGGGGGNISIGSGETSQDDGSSEDEEEDEGGEEGRQQAGQVMVGSDDGGGHGFDKEKAKEQGSVRSGNDYMGGHTNDDGSCFSPSQYGAGKTAADGEWCRRRATTKKSAHPSPTKSPKAAAAAAARGGGAADARAIAWEAAAAKAEAAKAEELAAVAAAAAGVMAAVGTKRNRTDSCSSSSSRLAPSHGLSIAGAFKGRQLTGRPQITRISPTSVSDINFMSFPVPHMEQSDAAMHHLPKQLAPSWCTKPQDDWTLMAGSDLGVDSDDAGPFRWFIDERSLSAPGAFFQPPAENWSGSDTTDVSTSAGICSGAEGLDGDCMAVVPELPVTTSKIHTSPRGESGASLGDEANPYPAKRRCVEPTTATISAESFRCSTQDAPVADDGDNTMANEVSRHVEADADGLDITSGLWLDHPQEVSSLICRPDLSTPIVAERGGSLSLPSLDESEVLGFLSCEENRPAGIIEL